VTNLFQTLAGAAGLAGLSLGVVLLIFRDIIKKNIFPKLSSEHAYGILRLIIKLTFAVGVLGMCLWAVDRGHMLNFVKGWDTDNSRAQSPKVADTPLPLPLDGRTENEIRRRTIAIIASTLNVPVSAVRPETRLYSHSFDLVFLMEQLEVAFNIEIADSESHSFRTTEDVVKCVELHIASRER
jgi:acyl carrier protein